MIFEPAKPFSSGTEYEFFLETHCYKCKKYKENKYGFPETSKNGGCPILDAMENARFDLNKFPSKDIVTVKDDNGKVLNWYECLKFEKRR